MSAVHLPLVLDNIVLEQVSQQWPGFLFKGNPQDRQKRMRSFSYRQGSHYLIIIILLSLLSLS